MGIWKKPWLFLRGSLITKTLKKSSIIAFIILFTFAIEASIEGFFNYPIGGLEHIHCKLKALNIFLTCN